MRKSSRATAMRQVVFATVLNGRHLINVSVGPSYDPVLLSLEGIPDYRKETNHGSFAKKQAARPNQFRIHRLAGNEWVTTDLPATKENYHFVQALPGAEWLLVRARATGAKDRNAHVHAPDGRLLRSFHAGDGIQDVQTTEQGLVWVSYFDEGVFGDTQLGRSGLACLDRRGQVSFRFTDLSTERLVQNMADCYALNVCSDTETWLYYYTDFLLVRLVERQLAASWMMPIRGSHGFAVDGSRVLLGGSYDRQESLFLGDLETLKFRQMTPVDEGGRPLKKFRAFGREHNLYLAVEKALYVVDLRAL